METTVEQCPLCGTELSKTKFREIQSKLQEGEQRKAAAFKQAELAMRQRLEQQFKLDLETQKRTTEKTVREEAGQEIKKVVAERDQAARKLKEAQEREAKILKQAQEDQNQRQKELMEQRQTLERKDAEPAEAGREVQS